LEPRDFSDLVDQLSMCRMLISARMHAGIAGLCAGIPVGLLAYEEKHHALFEDLRLANYVTSVRRPGDLPRLVGRLDVADPEAFAHAAISGREALAARYGH
jgi:hypothetical protein